ALRLPRRRTRCGRGEGARGTGSLSNGWPIAHRGPRRSPATPSARGLRERGPQQATPAPAADPPPPSVVEALEVPGIRHPIVVDERQPLPADHLEVVAGDRAAPPVLLDAPPVAHLDRF